jgi:hypothetical protein
MSRVQQFHIRQKETRSAVRQPGLLNRCRGPMSTTPTVQLHQIAEIRMGVTLRGRDATRHDPKGSCFLIRIGDLSDDGQLITEDLHPFEPGEDLRPDHFLRSGDVLLPNRGTRCTAYVYDLPLGNVIAGAQFYLLRPDWARVHPGYLGWFLRSEKAASYFALRRKGTLVQTLQRRDVLELELPLPNLEKQNQITAVDALAIRERQLAGELAQLKAAYLQRTLFRAASG